MKNLIEIKWLIQEFKLSIKLYIDHQTLLKDLQNENMINKLIKGQLILSEFNLNIVYVAEKNLTIIDDLSKFNNLFLTTSFFIKISLIVFTAEEFQFTKNIQISWKNNWKKWLNDSWYADIIKAKIIENYKTKEFLFEAFTKVTKKKNNKYVLIDEKSKALAFKKKNGKLTRYLYEFKIFKTLIFLYNVHDHFVEKIILRKIIKQFFWSIYHKNVTNFCKTYINCQMSKSFKSFQKLLFIVFLQSLNIMNIDYIDFIIFIIKSETKFMCISVDYFTQYLFANVISFVIFENIIIFFEKFIIQNFEWFWMIYFDNELHFKKDFDAKLKKQKMKYYFASINHSKSIKLTKKYVRIML